MSQSDDIFEDAPPALGTQRPNIRQLASGAKKGKRTYAKGEAQEFTGDIEGRLLIIVPKKLETGVPSQFKDPKTGQPKLQDRITADVHVLDGTPITQVIDGEGDVKLELKEPLTPPFMIPDAYISQTMLVQQLEDVVGTGKFRFGRLGFLPPRPPNKKPFVLFGTTEDEKAQAKQYWNSRPDPFGE